MIGKIAYSRWTHTNRGTLSPVSPDCEIITTTSPTRYSSLGDEKIPYAPEERNKFKSKHSTDESPQTPSPRKESLKPTSIPNDPESAKPITKRGLRRQSTAYDEILSVRPPSNGLTGNNLLPIWDDEKENGIQESVNVVNDVRDELIVFETNGTNKFLHPPPDYHNNSRSISSTFKKRHEPWALSVNESLEKAKGGGRRGSRPFLSPDMTVDVDMKDYKYRPTRRDSLSPDSASNEEGRGSKRNSKPDSSNSREESPRRRTGGQLRRSSCLSEDGAKIHYRYRNHNSPESSSAHSSIEHSPKDTESRPNLNSNRYQMRRQSTTEEILIARGFRMEASNEDMLRRRNFRRQSTQIEPPPRTRGRRDSCTQITDGLVETMTIESDKSVYDQFSQSERKKKRNSMPTESVDDETNTKAEGLEGLKNQVLCDLHFADMALVESSDFMQQLRNFKPQSLGCAVARRKKFDDAYIPSTSSSMFGGSAWTIDNQYLSEIDEGRANSTESKDSEEQQHYEQNIGVFPFNRSHRKTPVEELWEKDGSFGLTSVEQETHEKYFYGTEHWNYFTNDEDLGPVILSLKQENINGRDQFRILVRAVSYTIHGLIPASCVFADRYNREEIPRKSCLNLTKFFIKSELKVGVIYVKENQSTEEEILNNNHHTPNFDEFLSIIGDKVRLKGLDRYKGGLDTVHDLTGTHSVFTQWRGIEIMFHVSTMLPYEESDSQKLQRKRHIGNDIVCLVFLETNETPFSPSCIKSHFLHTFIVVKCSPTPRKRPNIYEISVVTRDEVGAYKPYLWEQSKFVKGPMFREWLLTKVVNAERASYSAPKFARMQERTRSQMLEDLVANLQNHTETGQIPKPYRRGSWRPIGHMRPSSPLLDSVRDLFEGQDQMARDFVKAFYIPKNREPEFVNLFDITFHVGQGKIKTKLYGVRAILGVRSRVFQELLYGISTGFGSPQVPVAELLARATPNLNHNQQNTKPKSSNFLQVPDIEGPRIPRAFSNLRNQLTTAWNSTSKQKKQDRLTGDDKKKWPSVHDCSGNEVKDRRANHPSLNVPRLSVCADSHKVDRSKLAQNEFNIIEFDGETYFKHVFHHAKQFIRTEVACQMLSSLENYYWRYTSASELVNMILVFIETRALPVFSNPHFLDLSESMVQMIMSRNLEVQEVAKFEAMLKWAQHRVKTKSFSNRVDAKIEFRCCMDRLTRDLKLYRIAPLDLIKVVLPSKSIRNEKILETLMVQANSGKYRIQDSYFEACQKFQKQDSHTSEWESMDYS
ncbi:Signal-induced proliferation-associated 1-like protein 1,Rap1 GTPase-activating protein 2,Rap1 GTPase-activating protein 1,GTPase-activating protein DDB_G0291510 [Lepeophtheirus salmonis]|uniref:Signal-induced proliferation-associated 1-like protein 1,Rap1 GTPase-activating protein 2,Rap1 GTPase-activating protein 1,GTPase-activating protein DDB_G0291510 n=1 Tax=Lepeophtheirus salmonis TaxID=72036 RepID=A0A7R8CQ51_LEPSM|nr:Signal-induced proliferation-associated 1-like protein 1,Rap1 GTPase-activating protein 2,Rap1 GTPase-activating protein 1,GTPase-activating protein DDB_G0291510 [Lepeophtheirus salmonis]CAF2845048.1 Signal-induced proliferation-associated 1-like protein 1,Rap1 GTPase-activating protein 2,Rap1 GTPase-activating protein 1,GTPase-activating protein DDB_G0291510 [Lepeophtheirus salmonis]